MKKWKRKNINDKIVLTHTKYKHPFLLLKRKELDNKHYFGGINLDTTQLSDNVLWHL